MRWIVSAGVDIAVNPAQLQARKEYIEEVTGSLVSTWLPMRINNQLSKEFVCCVSNDGIDGTFITAHIGQVYRLCELREITEGEFVVANTCIWEHLAHKTLLRNLMRRNKDIQLWFAKQELSLDSYGTFRQSTTLSNIGQFGFQTSFSERELYRHRKEGLFCAIQKSFDLVSPFILPGEEVYLE